MSDEIKTVEQSLETAKEITLPKEGRTNFGKASEDGKRDSIGKFQSPEALFQAYKSLEAEFTKKSQRLKEMEGNQFGLSDSCSLNQAMPLLKPGGMFSGQKR